jgi:hypothetical protein
MMRKSGPLVARAALLTGASSEVSRFSDPRSKDPEKCDALRNFRGHPFPPSEHCFVPFATVVPGHAHHGDFAGAMSSKPHKKALTVLLICNKKGNYAIGSGATACSTFRHLR